MKWIKKPTITCIMEGGDFYSIYSGSFKAWKTGGPDSYRITVKRTIRVGRSDFDDDAFNAAAQQLVRELMEEVGIND